MSDLYNLSVKDIQLNDIDLSSFQGKMLPANVALHLSIKICRISLINTKNKG